VLVGVLVSGKDSAHVVALQDRYQASLDTLTSAVRTDGIWRLMNERKDVPNRLVCLRRCQRAL
jgi:hypothetical protein